MGTEKKQTWKEKIHKWITPSIIIGFGSAMLTGLWWVNQKVIEDIELRIKQKEIMFETPEQRIKTKVHINTPYNPVNAYIQSVELTEQSIKVDSTLNVVQKIINDTKDREERIAKSRASRDSSQRVQAEQARIQSEQLKSNSEMLGKILKKIDSLEN